MSVHIVSIRTAIAIGTGAMARVIAVTRRLHHAAFVVTSASVRFYILNEPRGLKLRLFRALEAVPEIQNMSYTSNFDT